MVQPTPPENLSPLGLTRNGSSKHRQTHGPEVTAGVRVYPLPAAHYGLDQAAGDYAYLGFVLDIEGIRVYHSGDTLIYPELMEYLKPLLPIDVALLPINGRHAFREAQGFIGNMTYQEAADLAGTLGG